MAKFVITTRYIALFATCCLLCACLGGTIAQQIARSIATSVADKAMARAMNVDEDEDYSEAQYTASANLSAENNAIQKSALQGSSSQYSALQKNVSQNSQLQNTVPDDYWYAMANSGFEPVRPITEPLPEENIEVETRIAIVQGNQLVRVELFNLLIGDEKNAVYEQARLIGATSLPKKNEWQSWRVGTGEIQTKVEKDKKVITFLIPPEFGKLPSGAIALVELASPGELNIARYKANDDIKVIANR
jgi:hypothetical protein